VTLLAVGDVWSPRPAAWPGFDLVRALVSGADVFFANCEGVLADDAEVPDTAPLPLVAPRAAARGLRDSGIDVMSCANNHIFDGGARGLRSTLAELEALGIATAGAGVDDVEAARPAVLSVSGTSIAVLAYGAVYPAATPPGPGAPASTRCPSTLPTSSAWPPTSRRPVRRRITSSSAPTGARGCTHGSCTTMNDGSPITRSTRAPTRCSAITTTACAGSRSMPGARSSTASAISRSRSRASALAGPPLVAALRDREGEYAMYERKGFPLLPFHPDARQTLIASVTFGDGEVLAAGFIPCRIGPDGRVEALDARTADGERIAEWVRRASRQAGSDPRLRVGPGTMGGLPLVEFLPV
jgi:hypothetical protein